jgi:hypothetical protein
MLQNADAAAAAAAAQSSSTKLQHKAAVAVFDANVVGH